MKKFKRIAFSLICICLMLSLTSCQNGNNGKNASVNTSSPQSSESTPHESNSQQQTDTEKISEETTSETEEPHNEKKRLPEGVVLSGIGFTVTDEEPNEVTYGDDGIWQIASFENFIYASEPNETEFKKYRIGDTVGGLTVKSAGFSFANMCLDNDYHEEGCRVNSHAVFDGTLTLSGTLIVAE